MDRLERAASPHEVLREITDLKEQAPAPASLNSRGKTLEMGTRVSFAHLPSWAVRPRVPRSAARTNLGSAPPSRQLEGERGQGFIPRLGIETGVDSEVI